MISDTHVHSIHSMDCNATQDEMTERAIALGGGYIAFTDHYNADYLNILPAYRENCLELKYPLDVENHIKETLKTQEKYKDRIYVGVGVECGWSPSAEPIYSDTVRRENFDVIINSVHTVKGGDIYSPIFFSGNESREEMFSAYLDAVRASIDAPYDYDIIGHIGYFSRKAPYENNLITLNEFGDRINDILKAIIRRDKCLECNSQRKNTPLEFLPGREILTRYYELGGRKISFGSDSHQPVRVLEHYGEVSSIAREIGFEGFTYFVKGEPRLAKF